MSDRSDRYNASQVDLLSYLSAHGYRLKRVGREYSLPDIGDSLYVNPEKNQWNWFSQGKGGGAVQFLTQVLGMDERSAVKELLDFSPQHAPFIHNTVQKERAVFEKPPADGSYRNLFAYLTQIRGIDKTVIEELIHAGVLYQTEGEGGSRNAVFLHLDDEGKPCGADIVGLNSEVKYRKCLPHTDTDKGFVYKKGTSDNVYLFEAPIDLMSFIQLNPTENGTFVAMGGLKPSIADKYINDPQKRVISCVDNDEAGAAFNERIMLKKMMQCAIGSIPAEETGIHFLKYQKAGKNIGFFLSESDARSVTGLDRCFVWVNKSNFTVDTCCRESGVKDYNDLLKKQIALKAAIKSDRNTLTENAERTRRSVR